MVIWNSSGSPQLKDTFEQLADTIVHSELQDWNFVDTNLVETNTWSIDTNNMFRFQKNLHGIQSSEFKRVVSDLIVNKFLELGYKIQHIDRNQIIIEK